jgi:anti-anti-sigma factor
VAQARRSPLSLHHGLLGIHTVNAAGHWTLELQGELDLSNVATLDREIRLAEASAEKITVDLRGLGFMDSSGVRSILAAQQRSTDRLRLRRGSSRVQLAFCLTGTEEELRFEE